MHTTDESKVTFSQSGQYCEPAPWSRNRRAPRSPLLSLPASTLPKGDHCPELDHYVFPEQLDFIADGKCTWDSGGPSHSPCCGEDSRRR